jgi:hypothetical protein
VCESYQLSLHDISIYADSTTSPFVHTHKLQLIRRLEDEVARRDTAVSEAQSRASAAEAAAKEVHRKLEEAENALAKQQRTGRAQVATNQ